MTITFVGDIFPGNLPYNRNCGVASLSTDEENITKFSQKITNVIGNSELVVGNLESPIIGDDKFVIEKQFAGSEGFLKILSSAGFKILSIANNHIFEHGLAGAIKTREVVSSAGINVIGTNDKNTGESICEIHMHGMHIGFLSYNAIDNKYNCDNFICEYNKEKICRKLNDLKNRDYDFVFLILHWGDEFINRPSKNQILDAHSFVDNGADFVICSHPHVIQPIEQYKGKLICYSLGNFIFDMVIPKSSKIGMMLKIELNKGSFSYDKFFIDIQNDFFPVLSKKTSKIEKLLNHELNSMDSFMTEDYEKTYRRDIIIRRAKKRILEKFLLIKNWNKYTPSIKKDIKKFYFNKIFK